MIKKKLLLHVCCAPCSTAVIERLQDHYQIIAFFYDPNIHPREEYELRRDEFAAWSQKLDIPFYEGEYDVQRWHEKARGHESDPERGERCTICYEMRMRRATEFAVEQGCEYFTTTLSVSPHKDYKRIKKIGEQLANEFGLKFVAEDFKKSGGYQRSVELSREQGMRRQNYCGCIHSRRKVK